MAPAKKTMLAALLDFPYTCRTKTACTMKRILLTGILTTALGLAGFAQNYTDLREGFCNPPREDRPEVWWHWMDGNISRDGILKDLEWMHRSGIGGVHIFDAGISMPQVVKEKLVYMRPEWKSAFRYALEVADSLGMTVTIPSSPGWSATGGPWVPVKDAMKRLVWRESRIEGGHRVNLVLPEPYSNKGRFQNVPLGNDMDDVSSMRLKTDLYYEDIAVVAVRLAENDHTLEERSATVSASGGNFTVALLSDGDLSAYKRLPLGKTEDYAWIQYEFPSPETFSSVSLAGERLHGSAAILQASDDGKTFREVARIGTGGTVQQTVSFAPVTGRLFRLVITNPANPGPVKYSKVSEFNLFGPARIEHAEEKAGFAAAVDLHRHPTPVNAGGPFTREVLDVSSYVKDGVLDWEAPAGRWKILRFGYALTGKVNHPSPLEATGLEVDKLDPRAFSAYLREYFDRFKEIAGPLMGERGLQYVLTDSYEAGPQTWTPAMMTEFKTRRGYDLLPWMPVLTGDIIGSVAESERFLFDWRRTIGELFAENYDRITEISREYGLKGRYSESHEGGRGYLVDGMDVKRSAQVPMSACWMPNRQGIGGSARADIRESASVAHVFGQNIVAAESFTASGLDGRGWSYAPAELKRVADLELSEGLNHFVIHESPHQPVDSLVPGLGLMTFGQWFSRNETWAHEAKGWTDYLARSSYMLRAGNYMADVLIYYGEDTNITAKYAGGLPGYVPEGFDYDFINSTGLLRDLAKPYSVLCIDDDAPEFRSPEVAAKLASLEKAGMAVCTPKELDSVLKKMKIQPDVVLPSGMAWVHRHTPDSEIYWLSRPGKEGAQVVASFRIKGKKPLIWHPETGLMEEVTYRQEKGRTIVNLEMGPDDAVFVVFHGKGPKMQTIAKKPVTEEYEFNAPWTVRFQDGRGAPESAVFQSLSSLSESENPLIRYFSGTADYTTRFKWAGTNAGKQILDLGEVYDMARVFVNGRDCGLVWKAPYRMDISRMLQPGQNEIRVEVTNVWTNRIIGDLRPDGGKRVTWTSMQFYTAESPLRPSGLVGPVKLISY